MNNRNADIERRVIETAQRCGVNPASDAVRRFRKLIALTLPKMTLEEAMRISIEHKEEEGVE